MIDARGTDLSFTILVLGGDGYTASLDREGVPRSEVFGRSFALARERNRVGRWRYRLDVLRTD